MVTIKSLSKEVDILKEQAKEIIILKEKYDDMEKIVDILKKELDHCKSTHSRMDTHDNDVSDALYVKRDDNCIENIVKYQVCEQTFTCIVFLCVKLQLQPTKTLEMRAKTV